MSHNPVKKDTGEDTVCRISIISTDSSELEMDVLENLDDIDGESHVVEDYQTNYNLLSPVTPNPDPYTQRQNYENPWPGRNIAGHRLKTSIVEECDDIFNTDEKLVSVLLISAELEDYLI
jgi:hypothetical protein